MSNDDSRGKESPDRPDASTRDHPTPETVHGHLEQVDALTRTLLAVLEAPTAETNVFEDLSDRERRAVRRHLLQIRAEASQVGLTVLGPEGAISYRPSDGSTGDQTHDSSGRPSGDPTPSQTTDSSDDSPRDSSEPTRGGDDDE